jgi:polysaccharide biosynthesis protein PslJ
VLVATDRRPALRSTPDVEASGAPTRGAPVTILRIYAALLVLVPPTHIIEPLGAVGTPATVAALVALMLWAVGVLAPGTYLCRTVVPLRVVMGVFVATTFLSYAVAHVRYVPAVELLASDRALIQLFGWGGVALLAAEGLRDRVELYRVLRVFVAAVAAMALIGLFQFRFGIDFAENVNRIPGLHENADLVSIQDRAGFRRPAGTATHPIEFGCVIAMALPLALHLARFDLARSAFRRWFPVVAIVIGIPVAVSRSAVLAALVAAIVIFIGLEPTLRPRALAWAAAFVVAIYATTPGLLGTLSGLFLNAGEDSSISYRTNDYATVGDFIRQSPWFGRGPGTFVASSYIILDNQYLLTAIEIGLVGLVVVTGYLLAAAFLGRGARHATEEPAARDLGQALAAASLAGAVAAITFDGFSFLMFAGVVPLCLGIAGALWKSTRVAKRRAVPVHKFDASSSDGRPQPPAQALHAPAVGEPPWTNGGDRIVEVRDAGSDSSRHPKPVPAVGGGNKEPIGGPLAEFVGGVPGSPTRRADTRRRTAAAGVGVGAVIIGGLLLSIGRGGADDPQVGGARVVAGPLDVPTSTSTTVPAGDTGASPPKETTATRPRIIAEAEPDTDAGPMVRPLRSDTDVAVTSRPRSTGSTPSTVPPSMGSPTTTHPTAPPATSPPPTSPPTTSPPTTSPPTTSPPTTSPPTTSPPTTEPQATTTTTVAAAVPETEPPPPPPPEQPPQP